MLGRRREARDAGQLTARRSPTRYAIHVLAPGILAGAIVVTGHSAGGQVVHRYAAASPFQDVGHSSSSMYTSVEGLAALFDP